MTNISHMPVADPIRQARAEFVDHAIDADGRSARYVAGKIGVSPSSLGQRLSGRVAFTAEDIERIAYVLKRDPVDFYREYLAAQAGPDGNGWAPSGSNRRPADYSSDASVVNLDDWRRSA